MINFYCKATREVKDTLGLQKNVVNIKLILI